jgi:protein-L-isoaspartate(D-aspartate) O-methyltransferase
MDINFDELRVRMVDGQVRTTDVTDRRLLGALLDVPREAFVPADKRPIAYIDEDVAVLAAGAPGGPRYLVEPSPFAKLVQLAAIGAGDAVLDVGCATGYSSAVIAHLARSVVALESDPGLARTASETLPGLGHDNVVVAQGPLEQGHSAKAPYDVIVLEGAVDFVPQALFSQLKNGGRLVAVEGRGNAGVAKLYVKDEDGKVAGRRVFNAAIPALPGFRREPSFQF